MNYKQSGVDTQKAQKSLQKVKNFILKTHQSSLGNVIDNFGSFAGIFQKKKYIFSSKNLLAASTDGVGTKLEVYHKYNHYEGIGFDLVAMCVNDLYCVGAEPAFFLDYIACEKLDHKWYSPVIQSISEACQSISIPLLGGETAEHPKAMLANTFDLAGFSVGFVKKKNILPKINQIKQDDIIIGLPSNGLHSNGFSLIREFLKKDNRRGGGKVFQAMVKILFHEHGEVGFLKQSEVAKPNRC